MRETDTYVSGKMAVKATLAKVVSLGGNIRLLTEAEEDPHD